MNLWYGRSADDSPATPPFATNYGSVTRKESPSAPIRCAGPVSSATFDKVRRVWLAAFAAARSSDRLGFTIADPDWVPLNTTPPFQETTSAHAVVAGASGRQASG